MVPTIQMKLFQLAPLTFHLKDFGREGTNRDTHKINFFRFIRRSQSPHGVWPAALDYKGPQVLKVNNVISKVEFSFRVGSPKSDISTSVMEKTDNVS